MIIPTVLIVFAAPLLATAWNEDKLILNTKLHYGFLQDPAATIGWFIVLPLSCVFTTAFYQSATNYLRYLAVKYHDIDKMLGSQIEDAIIFKWRFYLLVLGAVAIFLIPIQLYGGNLGRSYSWHFSAPGVWSNTQILYFINLLILVPSLALLFIKYGLILMWLRHVYESIGDQEIQLTHEKEIWGLRKFAETFRHIYFLILILGMAVFSIIYTNVILWEESVTNYKTSGFVSFFFFAVVSPFSIIAPSIVTGVRKLIKLKKEELLLSLSNEYQRILAEVTLSNNRKNNRIHSLDNLHNIISNIDKSPTIAVDPTFYKWFKALHIVMPILTPAIAPHIKAILVAIALHI